MNKIKNIIFDLGGVIYDIRYENIAEAFARHGVTDLGEFYSSSFQTSEFTRFELGLMSVPDFRNYVREATHTNLDDDAVDEIINAILIDIPFKRIELLMALKGKYRVFLFSNTNQINYDYYTRRMWERYSIDIFKTCFDACYFSHQIHLRKPDPEGFRLIVREQGLIPSETVFIDDIAQNLEGAQQVGLRTFHLHDTDITDLFDKNLIPVAKLRHL